MNNNSELKNIGLKFLKDEINQAKNMLTRIDNDFVEACHLLLEVKGKVIVMGVGKSGHIGRKIAATLASTGTPSFFIHPADALHGDFGMVGKDDVMILISYSGEANEFIMLLPLLVMRGNKIISITGRKDSTLAKKSDAILNVSIEKEACPLGLAPTSSALCTLMMGDALALTIMSKKEFTENEFALSHPAGSLGASLLTTVNDIIDKDLHNVSCSPQSTLFDAVNSLCLNGKGLIAVTNENTVIGVFSDGDFRRAIALGANLTDSIGKYMSKKFVYSNPETLCSKALNMMYKHQVTALPIINENKKLISLINIYQINSKGIY